MSHTPKQEQARIIGQLNGIYKNLTTLITPSINQIDFEKAVSEDKIEFYFEDVVKGFSADILKSIDSEQDEIKKSEILSESKKDLSRLELVNVMFDNLVKGLYVDVIDIETKTYKDNAINRIFDRVGKPVK